MTKVKSPKFVKKVSLRSLNEESGLKPTNGKVANKTEGKVKTKTQKKNAKKAAKVARVATKGSKAETVHLTDRYRSSGHPKGAASTRVTEKRRKIEDLVSSGATIGDVVSQYGRTGLKNVARHIRFGRYVVKGFNADAKPKLDALADAAIAGKLAKATQTLKISVVKDPTRLVE